MYAVFRSGGKQHRIIKGQKLKLELLEGEEGSTIELNDILMIAEDDSLIVDKQDLASAKISAKILSHGRGKKINIVKFRRRKHSRKQMGHRQSYTEVQIEDIIK